MILVCGLNGQVATSLMKLKPNEEVVQIPSSDLQFPFEVLAAHLEKYKPSVVINAAAYTQVDKAESDQDSCWQANAFLPKFLAHWCDEHNTILVHYSTDYVFPGTGEKPWTEEDPKQPVNFYGLSKLEGEKNIRMTCQKHLIFRTAWVYNQTGANFLKTIIRLAKERDELKIVSDQIGSPSYAHDLAEMTWKALAQARAPGFQDWGIYHMTNSDYGSWFDFASEVVNKIKEKNLDTLKVHSIQPIPSEMFPTPAARPRNSRLNLGRLNEVFGLKPTPWKNAVERCLNEIYKN